MSEMSGDVYGGGDSASARTGDTNRDLGVETGGTPGDAVGYQSIGATAAVDAGAGASGGAGGAALGAWERASRTAVDLRGRVADQAGTLGRRLREAPLTQRLGEAIEERPWTALMVALGLGAALGAATGRGSSDDVATRRAGEGDDYLAEYEDALVAGSGRWAARGRAAVTDVGRARIAASGATAGGTEEWRPSDEQLAGEHDALGEMGRGSPANRGAMEGRVTRESWERGMIE